MAQRFHIGKKFENFSTFESAIERYQNAEYVQFWKRNNRTISAAQSRLPKKSLNPRLKYYEIRYYCSQGGKPFKSKSTGRGMYVFSSFHLSICLSFHLSVIVSNDIRYPAGISTLNQRQTSTLKQCWNMVGFESWMDVEMTLNQRWLPSYKMASKYGRKGKQQK